MGTAFASLVTGLLILLTHFDEKQTTRADEIYGHINVVAKALQAGDPAEHGKIAGELAAASGKLHELAAHFAERASAGEPEAPHYRELGVTLDGIESKLRTTISITVSRPPSRRSRIRRGNEVTQSRARLSRSMAQAPSTRSRPP